MKAMFNGIYVSTSWYPNKIGDALKILAGIPGLSDRTQGYLKKKLAGFGNKKERDIFFNALSYEGFTRSLFPSGCFYDDADAFRKRQWQLIEALAPCLVDGDILMEETPEDPNGYLEDTIFYGYRIRDGHAVRLGVLLQEIHEAGEQAELEDISVDVNACCQ